MKMALIGAMAGVALGACGVESTEEIGRAQSGMFEDGGSCPADERTNWGGQTHDTGSVSIGSDGTNLIVTITGENGWLVDEWHLFAGTGSPPVNKKGNAAPGQYPYQGDPDSEGEVQISIPLANLGAGCDETLNVAVHTVMVKLGDKGKREEQTAWAAWDTEWSNQWGGWFQHTICCGDDGGEDPPPPPPDEGDDCVKAPWYYGQNPDVWPVDSLNLGSTSYTKDELLTIMGLDWYDLGGDVSVYLAQMVIGVRLNEADGVTLPDSIVDALALADQWFDDYADDDGKVPYGVLKDTPEGDSIATTKNQLYEWVVGLGETPFCGK